MLHALSLPVTGLMMQPEVTDYLYQIQSDSPGDGWECIGACGWPAFVRLPEFRDNPPKRWRKLKSLCLPEEIPEIII